MLSATFTSAIVKVLGTLIVDEVGVATPPAGRLEE